MGGLARATHREVTHGDHGQVELDRANDPIVVKGIAQGDPDAVQQGQGGEE